MGSALHGTARAFSCAEPWFPKELTESAEPAEGGDGHLYRLRKYQHHEQAHVLEAYDSEISYVDRKIQELYEDLGPGHLDYRHQRPR